MRTLYLCLVATVVVAPGPARAETVALGAMRLSPDPLHWALAERTPEQVTLIQRRPGEPADGQRLRVSLRDGDAACPVPPDTGANALQSPQREAGPMLGGLPTETIVRHTGCRNLVLPAMSVCARHRGRLYVVEMAPTGCRGGSVAPHVFGALMDSVRFQD
jgi:hypothetical protein